MTCRVRPSSNERVRMRRLLLLWVATWLGTYTPAFASEVQVRTQALAAGLTPSQVDDLLATARSLRERGVDPEPFYDKLTEGLAKRVSPERLVAAMRNYAERLEQAARLSRTHDLTGRTVLVLSVSLLAGGAKADEVAALMKAAEGPRRDRTYASLALGAKQMREAGAEWSDAVGFETALARNQLAVEDIDDVNEAVSAALRDGLLKSDQLRHLPTLRLATPGEARRFVGDVHRGALTGFEPADRRETKERRDENAREPKLRGRAKDKGTEKVKAKDRPTRYEDDRQREDPKSRPEKH